MENAHSWPQPLSNLSRVQSPHTSDRWASAQLAPPPLPTQSRAGSPDSSVSASPGDHCGLTGFCLLCPTPCLLHTHSARAHHSLCALSRVWNRHSEKLRIGKHRLLFLRTSHWFRGSMKYMKLESSTSLRYRSLWKDGRDEYMGTRNTNQDTPNS